MVSTDSLEFKIFQETLDITKTLVLDLNLSGKLRVPVQKPKSTKPKDFEKFKKIIFLIGEQHQGGCYRNISFAHSNRTLTELVLRLVDHPRLEIKTFFKEGLSEIKFHPELGNISKEDFIINHTHPLVTALHLNHNQINIFNCEAKNLFIEYALLSLLHCSIPGVSKMPEQEISRIKNLINYYENDEEISQIIIDTVSTNEIEFGLAQLKKEKFLRNITINGIEFYCYNDRAEPNQALENLKYLIQAKLKRLLIARDQEITQRLIQSPSVFSALLIGDLHLENLKNNLEKEKIPVISISTFI
jgi:hypothetical protein